MHLGATQCARALDEKYEKRMQRLVKEGNLYAAEYLTHLKYRESVNSLRKKCEKSEGVAFDVVILARPDVVYTSSLQSLCMLTKMLLCSSLAIVWWDQ